MNNPLLQRSSGPLVLRGCLRFAPTGRWAAGFTLVELVVVVATLACLAFVMAPALARTRPNSQAFQCLNNHRQLCAAWRMYAEDSNGSFCYASTSVGTGPPGTSPNKPDDYAWSAAHMDFNGNNYGNWDPNYDMVKRPLWPYAKSQTIYKCPSDRSTVFAFGVNRPRILSMSMNLYVGGFAPVTGVDLGPDGTGGGWPWARPFRVYARLSAISGSKGPPSKIFVFLDMREDRVNWSNFMTAMSGYSETTPDPSQYTLFDLPGFYHNRGCSFSFVDGHGEIKRWLDPRTTPPIGPVAPDGSGFSCPGNKDVAWLQDHTTRRN